MSRGVFTIVTAMFLGSASLGAQGYPSLDSIVRGGIRRGIYPGAIVVVGQANRIVFSREYGHYT